MNFFALLALAQQIYGAISALAGGQPVTLRTYIGGKHVSVTLQEIP